MTFWLVRAGKHGEQENGAIKNNVITIGWDELPDLSKIDSRDELKTTYNEFYGGNSKRHVAQVVGQILKFVKEISKGDLVALPLKTAPGIRIGKVTGDYQFKEIQDDIKHIRGVEWYETVFPRSAFDQDILNSLGAFLTVGEVHAHNAEERVQKMLSGQIPSGNKDEEIDATDDDYDLERRARDEIITVLGTKFKNHNLSRLINAILIAKGYTTKQSPPGADGGVDILAGSGKLGFESPKICVQVKSSEKAIDVTVVRELDGVVKSFNADYGLLVAWGGLTGSAIKESIQKFFSIRLWSQEDIVDEIIKNYENIDSSIKAELPLKSIFLFDDSET